MVQEGACICCFQRTIYPKIGLYNKLNVFSSYFSETYAPAQTLAPQSKNIYYVSFPGRVAHFPTDQQFLNFMCFFGDYILKSRMLP